MTKTGLDSSQNNNGMSHLSINSTLYKKLMALYWKEDVSNPLHRDALNLHTGYSQSTAQDYYEVASSKKRDAALASHYTDFVLTRGDFSAKELDSSNESKEIDDEDDDIESEDHNKDDSIDMPRKSNFPHAVPLTFVSSGSGATVTHRRPLNVNEIANFIKNRQQRRNRQK